MQLVAEGVNLAELVGIDACVLVLLVWVRSLVPSRHAILLRRQVLRMFEPLDGVQLLHGRRRGSTATLPTPQAIIT